MIYIKYHYSSVARFVMFYLSVTNIKFFLQKFIYYCAGLRDLFWTVTKYHKVEMKFRIDLKFLALLLLFFLTNQIKTYIIVMIFAFLHEISHLIIGKMLGFKPTEFELMPFGFRIKLNPKIEDYNIHILKSNLVQLKYIFIAIAGPMFNLICVVLFYNDSLCCLILGKYQNILELRQIVIYSNLLLFAFNLIPIYPLDGR